MSDDRRSVRLGVDDVVAVLAVLALTAIALLGFHSSYGGTHFMIVGTIAAVLGAGVAIGTRALGLGGWLSTLIAVGAYVVVGGVLALPDRGTAGVLPSADTMRLSVEQAVVGWKELITITPPVGRTGDLMVIPVVCGFAAAFAGSTLALRLRTAWPAIVPPAIVGGLSILTGVNQPAAPVMQGAVFAGIAMAWLAWREHRCRPLLGAPTADRSRAVLAVVLLVLAFGAGHVAAESLPFASDERDTWRRTVTPPFDPREHPSPLAGYRAYIKAAADAEADDPVLFTIEGLPADVPVRLATMDAYDGLVWQVSPGDPNNPSLRSSGSFVRVGEAIEPDFQGEVAEITVAVRQYSDLWVPTVGEVESLRFSGSSAGDDRDRRLNAAFRYNLGTDTAAAPPRLEPGDRYVMTVRLPAVVDELAGYEIIPEIAQLPPVAQVSAISEALITPLLEINDSGARLDSVREDFVEGGVYSDGDTNSDQLPSRAGHSVSRLVGFVDRYPEEQLIGNAEQFAATYALLFRELGLPTRVVMGFRPSTGSEADPVEVRAGDVDAWVEVPVVDLGWVDIAPTPDRDQIGLTDLAPQQPEPEYRTQNPPPPPLLDPEFENPATARGDVSATEEDDEEEENEPIVEVAGSGGNLAVRLAGVSLIGMAVVVLLAGAVILLVKRIRRDRRRRKGEPHVRIAHGWNEVTDLAIDMGRPVPATTTRREAAELVGQPSVLLAQRADAAVWGDGEPTEEEVEEFWAELESYLADVRHRAGVVGAFRAGVSAKSLRRRPRSDESGPSDEDGASTRAGNAARQVRALREAGSAEALVEFSGTYDETVDALHDVADEQRYSIVGSGPGTFRLERVRRPLWAKVLTVLLLPLAGLGLVFLLVRRRDAAVVSVIDDRDRPRVRFAGTSDDTLVAALRDRADPLRDGFWDVPESVEDSGSSVDEADVEADVVSTSDDRDAARPPDSVDDRPAADSAPDGATRVETPSAPPTDTVAGAATVVGSDAISVDDRTRAPGDSTPDPGSNDAEVDDHPSDHGPVDADATRDHDGDGESTIVRPTTRARLSMAPRLMLPDGEVIEVATGVVIGRDPDPRSPYDHFRRWASTDPSVSRTHVAVTVEGSALRVVDLGSSNGTTITVDGEKVSCEAGQPALAEVGSVIEVGDLALRVERPSR